MEGSSIAATPVSINTPRAFCCVVAMLVDLQSAHDFTPNTLISHPQSTHHLITKCCAEPNLPSGLSAAVAMLALVKSLFRKADGELQGAERVRLSGCVSRAGVLVIWQA